jgi:hypothetical protein
MAKIEKIWWEKTVEYFYISKYLHSFAMVVPLDGNHEKLSDAALSNGFQWIIIEFKKDLDWLRPEKEKFDKHGSGRYEDAKKTLLAEYGEDKGLNHHFLVYGEVSEEGDLSLKCEKYFSTPQKNVFDPSELFAKGLTFDRFKKYVEKLVWYKSRDNGDSGGNGNVTPPDTDLPDSGGVLSFSDYHSVFGVNVLKNEVTCMTIKEFVELASDKPGRTPPSQPAHPPREKNSIEHTKQVETYG